MFINRKIYSKDISSIHFESNETKGTFQAYDSQGHLLKSWNTIAHNLAQFDSMSRNFYNELSDLESIE